MTKTYDKANVTGFLEIPCLFWNDTLNNIVGVICKRYLVIFSETFHILCKTFTFWLPNLDQYDIA